MASSISTPILSLWGLLFLVSKTHATLPYNPTHLLQSWNGNNNNRVYIVESPSSSSPKGKLLLLVPENLLSTNKLPAYAVSKTLPFLENGTDLTFTPAIHSDGSISVYAGKCTQGSQDASLWRFTPDKDHYWHGSWKRQPYSTGNIAGNTMLSGTNWLASAISFSSTVTDHDNIYIFGGMCPQDGSSIADNSWVADASYSSQMLVFQPQSANSNHYDFSIPIGHGQPTPEAGFTITPLPPTYSKSVDGSRTQQQDFVLIGGHTQTAFIDMNLIALFSLPQASWTFLTVQGPDTKDELRAARDSTFVDSRSGHTAVLTSDGQRIVVFGGWVGDVSTPAEPQLVVLEVGAGYGGSKSWRWSHSDQLPFDAGAGIYGHGAALLPKGVMMVTGGFNIASSNSNRAKRSLQMQNNKNYFLNTTSGRWLPSYHLGNAGMAPSNRNDNDSGPLSSNTEKAGLGAGLGFGLLAIICLIFFAICYRRRLKQQKEEDSRQDVADQMQEKDIDDYAPNGSYRSSFSHGPRTVDGRGGNAAASGLWNGARQVKGQADSSAYEQTASGGRLAESSGNGGSIPNPNRGMRRSMYGRQGPYSGARYDDNRYHWGSRDMHAIPERDEESSSTGSSRQASSAQQKIGKGDISEKENLDPFRDPDPPQPVAIPRKPLPRASIVTPNPADIPKDPQPPPPLSPAEERHREMEGWIRDWAAADAASRNNSMASAATAKSGRESPSKSERTISNLSDKSVYSNVSARSGTALIANAANSSSSGSDGPSRNTSSRSIIRNYLPNIIPTTIFNPFASVSSSPSNTMTSTNETHPPPAVAANASRPTTASDSATNSGSGSSTSGDTVKDGESFASAKSTFTQLQAESEALLAMNTGLQPDSKPTFSRDSAEGSSPTRNSGRRATLVGGWVGSVRRGVVNALTATGVARAVSIAGETTGSRVTVIGSDGYYQHNANSNSTPSDSPVKSENDRTGLSLGMGRRNGSSSPSKKNRRSLPAGQERLSVLDHEADNGFGAGEEYRDERYDDDGSSKAMMKRSVSEGAAFWAAKQGAKDWEVNELATSSVRKRTGKTPPPLPATSKSVSNSSTAAAQIGKAVARSDVGWRSDGAWKGKTSTALDSAASTATSYQPSGDVEGKSGLTVIGPRRVNSRNRSQNNASNLTLRTTSNPDQPSSNEPSTGDAASDWDVEAAIEQRVVQVMFTVPRERLRVVNADIDVSSLVSSLREDVDIDNASNADGASIMSLDDDTVVADASHADPKSGVSETIVEEVEEENKAEAAMLLDRNVSSASRNA